MNSEDSAYDSQPLSATTLNAGTDSMGIKEKSRDDSSKMNNSTPNGYPVKIKSNDSLVSHKHDSSKSSEHRHSESSAHYNSDHIKRKEGDYAKHSSGDSHKHSSEHKKHSSESSKHSSSSKSKDASKISKSSSNNISKDHHHDKKNDSDKIKKDKSSSDKSRHDGVKKDKHHDDKHKEKLKDGHSSEHKSKEKLKSDSHKEKHGDKSKEKSDKHKEKTEVLKDKGDKPKDKIDKHKEKSDKLKEKEKSDKLKEKTDRTKEMNDKSKDKSKEKSDKPKDKSDKLKDKPEKLKSDKPKDKLKEGDKSKLNEKPKHVDANKSKHDNISDKKSHHKEHSKKSDDIRNSSVIVKTERVSPEKMVNSSIKQEPISPVKSTNESFSEDDIPLSRKKELIKSIIREKSEDESDDEPLSHKIGKIKKSTKTDKSSTKKRKTSSGEDSDYEYDKKLKTDKSSTKKRKTSSGEDSDYEYDKPKKKVKKEAAKAKKSIVKKEPKSEPTTPTSSPVKKGRVKKEDDQDVWKWWEEEKHEDGVKWRTLEHKGPVFAPLYERVPKSVKFYYDGKHMELSEETEEVAGFYGRMLDHDYTTKEAFNTNFFKDWKKVMTSKEREIIKDLSKCNFNDFNVYYKMKSEERKNRTKEEKQQTKKENEALTEEYGFCIIDGHRQKIGNFKIEPPGLFRGRGEHPKMGMLKRRIQPEDILINLGKTAKIPDPPAGHKWKEVRHDNTVTWLASWNENILNSTKYIMLNPSSKLKGEKDWQKYELARKLKNHADRIRKTYSEDFKSKEMRVRQRAVALYFIDKLALRAGNEKDEDTADTVGCCSLRVEHITLHEEKDGKPFVVSFDFLGKDSIRYVNDVSVEKRAFKNLRLFMENKQPGDDLFDRLNTSILNKYLNELMEGLTAKVFRTYNASKTLQEQLDLLTQEDMSLPERLLAYNRANRAVAILCNHQRSVPKTFDKSMENLKQKIDDKLETIRECKKDLKSLKSDVKNSGSAKDKVLLEKKKKRLAQLEDQLKKLEVQATDKEENKQIALGTSKLNYLDPRISVAWCKKWNVPIEKIYNRTQRDKFRWAIEMAGPEYSF